MASLALRLCNAINGEPVHPAHKTRARTAAEIPGALQQQIGHRPQSSSASPSRAGTFGFVLSLPMEKAAPTIVPQTAVVPPASSLRLRLRRAPSQSAARRNKLRAERSAFRRSFSEQYARPRALWGLSGSIEIG